MPFCDPSATESGGWSSSVFANAKIAHYQEDGRVEEAPCDTLAGLEGPAPHSKSTVRTPALPDKKTDKKTDGSPNPAASAWDASLPVVRIDSAKPPIHSQFAEYWRYRELLYFLVWRDVKVRYRQTALGIAWAVLQPLLAMLLFAIVFGRFARMPSDGIPYALFAYAGLLPWTFFSNAVTNAGQSLITNPDLVTKVYLPRMLVPSAAVLASLLDFAIAFVLLLVLMPYYQVAVTSSILLLPALVFLAVLFALALGLWTCAVNVKYRDVRYALPFAIQIGLFASPVIYPSSLVPAPWRSLLLLNPLTGIIEGFRSSLFGRPFDWVALAASVAITVAVLLLAARYFRRVEARFADMI
jgi:lipopolysaccharide transport system permease protein